MKKFKIIFSSRALKDLNEACLWYNYQQKALGKRLIANVKSTVVLIKKNPYFASVKYGNIRTVACHTFPYAIHYEVDETDKLIRIVSIFHFSRKPYWLDKD